MVNETAAEHKNRFFIKHTRPHGEQNMIKNTYTVSFSELDDEVS